ncbi:MAG: RNA methyltransferase [Alphaproteobacteria bacterium]|nr:MAG: RNA methyltransferase [Alphaproteobacteria bacterium]
MRHRSHSPQTHEKRRTPWRRKDPRPARGEARDLGARAILYGWHTVKAALENPARRIRRLYATPNAARRLAEDGVALAVEPELVRPDAIARRLGPDAVHNGVLAEADPLPSPELEELEPAGIVLVLDQITDPHNVGAILQNLARALAALRERGYFLVGLDSAGDIDLRDATLRTPLALVLGAEGKGLRQSTRASCDQLARLDFPGRIKTLNVSNAAALALHIVTKGSRSHP